MEDSDGFQLVNNNKKKSKTAGNQEAGASQSSCQQPKDTCYRLHFPKGVSPANRMIWLAEVADKHRNLSVTPRLTAKTVIAVTKDKDTVKFLTEIGHPYDGGIMKLTEITSENQRTKLMIRNYPSFLPLTFIENLPSVIKAERNFHRDTKTPRNQVTVLWEGEPPTQLHLPGIRPLKMERYVGKPTFCGKCQGWGHRAWECDKKERCGFCAESHDTKVCKEKLTAGEAIVSKCPNCSQEHHAWSPKCPMRPVTTFPRDKPTTTAAPPSPPPLTPEAFPPLPPAEHLQSGHQHPSSAAHPRLPHLTPSPPPPSPHTPPLHPPHPPAPQPSGQPHHPQPPHPTNPPASQAQDRPAHPPASQAFQEELPHPPRLQSHTQETELPVVPQVASQPSPHPAPLPPQVKPPRTPRSHNSTHISHITSKLEEEVKILRQEVKQLRDSQAALQKENRELRQQMATSMENMELEMSSMRAMMAQLLQNVTGTKPKQHRDQPNGVTEATVAATSETTTVTPTPKQTAVKEHQQPARQEVEAMDTCEDQTKHLTTEPLPPSQAAKSTPPSQSAKTTPPSQPGKPRHTPRQHRSQEREDKTPSPS